MYLFLYACLFNTMQRSLISSLKNAGNNFKNADRALTSHLCFRVSLKSSLRQQMPL